MKKRKFTFLKMAVLLAVATQAFSFNFRYGHPVFQIGGYWSSQGKAQHINIQGLEGDYFTVTKTNDSNGLVGLGYFFDAQETELYNIAYGINAFYLARTSVKGNIIQENLFTNLSYDYSVSHLPVYLTAKSTIKTDIQYALTIDTGIGPNFITTSKFKEHSLDGGITIPDNAFSGRTTTTFSAMAGIGLKISNVFGSMLPLECGYRFFYLGQGNFNKETNQLLSTLSTGSSYANALMCSITI